MRMLTSPYLMRQCPHPTLRMPIACRSVGHYSLFPGYHNRPTFKPFVELFWGIRGRGHFLLEGKEVVLKAGHVLVLRSNRVHDWTAHTHWEFRWMTLDGECPDTVVEALDIGETPIAAGLCPQQLFARLSHEIEDVSPKGQLAVSATAYEILTLATAQRPGVDATSSSVSECIDLIRKHYALPQVNVMWLAKKVGVHRTNLSKLFRATMRVSPIEYLTLFRVGKAMKLLQGSDLPIAQVASLTGFSCASYFTNVIRKRTGLSPMEIRGHRGALDVPYDLIEPDEPVPFPPQKLKSAT